MTREPFLREYLGRLEGRGGHIDGVPVQGTEESDEHFAARWDEFKRALSVRAERDRAVELLRGLGADRPGDEPVFRYPGAGCECAHCLNPRNHGQPIRDIRTALATAARKAGLAHMKLRFHDLRRTFGTLLLAQQGDLRLVQEALGHADIKTTARSYAHLLAGRREKATAALGDVLVERPVRRTA